MWFIKTCDIWGLRVFCFILAYIQQALCTVHLLCHYFEKKRKTIISWVCSPYGSFWSLFFFLGGGGGMVLKSFFLCSMVLLDELFHLFFTGRDNNAHIALLVHWVWVREREREKERERVCVPIDWLDDCFSRLVSWLCDFCTFYVYPVFLQN